MSPTAFLTHIKKTSPAPIYLFLGPETYQRDECRRALIETVLTPDERDAGFIQHDLEEITLANVIDDARSFSLFAPKRVIWVSRAEAAMPKGRAAAAASDDEEAKPASGGAEALQAYAADPPPGVTLVFDSSRFDFDGEDKARSERVRKFYSVVRDPVEFPKWSPAESRRLAEGLAKANKLQIGPAELNLIIEAVAGSPARIATEIEKLSLWAGEGGRITAADISRLMPQGHATTIFALVAALGRNDRTKALELLDTLVREGEYLPVALQFLSAQFRQALVVQEAGLRGSQQIMSHFQGRGVMMWPSRAEQVQQTATTFRPAQLRKALTQIAAADRAMKDIRPDDRTVMEQFVLTMGSTG
ncbi:MAG: DNA polymerase III subunit delta [Bryobacteraceae bacterium]